MAGESVILGDWGGTRLRLWLLHNGTTLASSEAPGLLVAREDPAKVLRTAIGRLGAATQPRRIVLCGMAGARNGLVEAGYVPCPGAVDEWVGTARETSLDNFTITILPGFATRDSEGRPDLMRGEEAQVFGALALLQQDSPRAIVLPGTHSKWVNMEGRRIARLATCPTGELHARLLGSSLADEAGAANTDGDAEGLASGIDRARNGGALMASLFEARAARLLDGRSAAWSRNFLSGLLIGSEIAAMEHRLEPDTPPLLVGAADLVALYRFAFEQFGLDCPTADGGSCVLAGLEIAHAKLG